MQFHLPGISLVYDGPTPASFSSKNILDESVYGIINIHTSARNNPERTDDAINLIKKIKNESQPLEKVESLSETLGAGKWPNEQNPPKHQRSRCNHLSQAWTRGQDTIYSQEPSTTYQFKVFTGPLRPISPHYNLVQYMNRVYKCCKLGFNCNLVRGLQGTLDVGDEGYMVEFFLDPEVLTATVVQAELHLEVPASDQLTVIPVLTTDGVQHFSFIPLRRDKITDLVLDVRFLLPMLKEVETGNMIHEEEVTELTLGLYCIQNGYHVPCDLHGISLLRYPFIVLHYK
ncbi:uncharacterized protein LOC128468855 [Spea bombifrons]|uniref:uncharacterized protein LOC128468855 n=1 Tax=Spea bombifrons TaxID=233779 RepID=UPI00234BE864|nr:uncharacterized protein LOC128468855 [Spea bombifrons]